MSGETYHLVEDFVDAEELEVAHMKGIKREVRGFAIKYFEEVEVAEQRSYRHEDKGMLVYVNPDELTADKKAMARKHLRDALSRLDAGDESGSED